eukprot:5547896-Amphidinium_carterae.1
MMLCNSTNEAIQLQLARRVCLLAWGSVVWGLSCKRCSAFLRGSLLGSALITPTPVKLEVRTQRSPPTSAAHSAFPFFSRALHAKSLLCRGSTVVQSPYL